MNPDTRSRLRARSTVPPTSSTFDLKCRTAATLRALGRAFALAAGVTACTRAGSSGEAQPPHGDAPTTALVTTVHASPKTEVTTAPPARRDKVDAQTTLTAAMLAGRVATHDDPELAEYLAGYAENVRTAYAHYDTTIGASMSSWSAAELGPHHGQTVFYPFSGADFVTAHRLFPDAERYVLVAMQRAGPVPALDRLDSRDLKKTLQIYRRTMETFARRGFFVTKQMNEKFARELPVKGITGQLITFATLEGYEVLSVEPVVVDAGGQLTVPSTAANKFRTWSSVRIQMRRRHDDRIVELDYLRLNLANEGFAEPGTRQLLEDAARGRVVLKAASHLMQTRAFTDIEQLLLDHAGTIVQDETGIGYERLTDRFDVKLYGAYERANHLFRATEQPALAEAYRADPAIDALPFGFGYRKTAGSCLQYAHLRRGSQVSRRAD